MSDTFEIIKGTRTGKVAGEEVTIREMSWMELKAFVEQMGGELEQLSQLTGADSALLKAETFFKVVKNSTELTESLLRTTTGRDNEWLGQLSGGEILGLVEQALDLNLRVIVDAAKKIGGRLQEAFGGRAAVPMTPTSGKSSTS